MTEKEFIKQCVDGFAKGMIDYQKKSIENYKSNEAIKNYAEGYIAGIECILSSLKTFETYASVYYGGGKDGRNDSGQED